jgi:hypothetical protein
MRSNFEILFKDLTDYSKQAGLDVGGICITHPWGLDSKIGYYDIDTFLDMYPLLDGVKMSDSWINAYRAFMGGLSMVEVVRIPETDTERFACVIKATDIVADRIKEVSMAEATDAVGVITLKYRGDLPDLYNNAYKKVSIKIAKLPVPAVAGDTDIQVTLMATKKKDNTEYPIIQVVGAIAKGRTVDGMDWDIVSKLKATKYFDAEFDYEKVNAAFATITTEKVIEITKESRTALTVEKVCQGYTQYFDSLEMSTASIFIDPGTTSATEASLVAKIAEERLNCCALVGYPTAAEWSEEKVKNYYDTIAGEKNTYFHCISEVFKLGGITYITNGIGFLAGAYANVANQVNVNQVPSGRSWGSLRTTLFRSFTEKEVMRMSKLGINGIYNSINGPRLWGFNTMYSRKESYFAKANVTRVTQRILRYVYEVAMDALHTGNTANKRTMVQNNIQADLNRLIADGALNPDSFVRCNDANNRDIDTNGKRILNIDIFCHFVSLIEKIRIKISAFDDTVNAELLQVK